MTTTELRGTRKQFSSTHSVPWWLRWRAVTSLLSVASLLLTVLWLTGRRTVVASRSAAWRCAVLLSTLWCAVLLSALWCAVLLSTRGCTVLLTALGCTILLATLGRAILLGTAVLTWRGTITTLRSATVTALLSVRLLVFGVVRGVNGPEDELDNLRKK